MIFLVSVRQPAYAKYCITIFICMTEHGTSAVFTIGACN